MALRQSAKTISKRRSPLVPQIKVEIENCTQCPQFIYTANKGAYCQKVGFDKMLKENTWEQFNIDFQSGNWHVPDWCPLKV